jgi:hypothetical protein
VKLYITLREASEGGIFVIVQLTFFFARCFGSGIDAKFKYFFTVIQSYPVLSDMSVMLKTCACSSLNIMYSSISSMVSNPGIFTQYSQLENFIPPKMGNF